ncbi:MAG: hypothetical protein LAO24_14020 [Acidobacteriia bacterium]|nr:hypothetical protein [Terriglobia bacterium]
MNHRNVRILTVLSFAVLWLAGVAEAQYAPHYVKVSIPFDFTVGDKSFPGGEYSLACTPGRVELRDARTHVVTTIFTHSVESLDRPAAPKLVFSADAGGRALRQVWMENDRYGYELAPSKTATALARQRPRAPVQISASGNKP